VLRRAALRALLSLCCLLALRAGAEPAMVRVVSLNPSLTEILISLGAREALVGVDDYSARANPEVATLPRVGGLFNPSLEAILALSPDLVVLVPSAEQRDLRDRLEALGSEVLALANITLPELLASIETLGARVGRASAGKALADRIRAAFAEAERASQGRPRPRTVLVLQRDPVFIVGSGSFLDEMLRVSGAENLGATFGEPYPRVDVEWLIAQAPELILDASMDAEPPRAYWQRWPSLPAVKADRIVPIAASAVTLPGPRLDQAVARLARAVRGEPEAKP
jgi:iron complex transport system substrate-binding protein